ncbi:MAG: hypothetical protein V2A58_00070 [Planctomycetota bacterium]
MEAAEVGELVHVFLFLEKQPAGRAERTAALERNALFPGGRIETLLRRDLKLTLSRDLPISVFVALGDRVGSIAALQEHIIGVGRERGFDYGDRTAFAVRARRFRDRLLGRGVLVNVLRSGAPAVAAELPQQGEVAPPELETPEAPPAIAERAPELVEVHVFMERRPGDPSELEHIARHSRVRPHGEIARLLAKNLGEELPAETRVKLWSDFGEDVANLSVIRWALVADARERGIEVNDASRFLVRGKRFKDPRCGRAVAISILSIAEPSPTPATEVLETPAEAVTVQEPPLEKTALEEPQEVEEAVQVAEPETALLEAAPEVPETHVIEEDLPHEHATTTALQEPAGVPVETPVEEVDLVPGAPAVAELEETPPAQTAIEEPPIPAEMTEERPAAVLEEEAAPPDLEAEAVFMEAVEEAVHEVAVVEAIPEEELLAEEAVELGEWAEPVPAFEAFCAAESMDGLALVAEELPSPIALEEAYSSAEGMAATSVLLEHEAPTPALSRVEGLVLEQGEPPPGDAPLLMERPSWGSPRALSLVGAPAGVEEFADAPTADVLASLADAPGFDAGGWSQPPVDVVAELEALATREVAEEKVAPAPEAPEAPPAPVEVSPVVTPRTTDDLLALLTGACSLLYESAVTDSLPSEASDVLCELDEAAICVQNRLDWTAGEGEHLDSPQGAVLLLGFPERRFLRTRSARLVCLGPKDGRELVLEDVDISTLAGDRRLLAPAMWFLVLQGLAARAESDLERAAVAKLAVLLTTVLPRLWALLGKDRDREALSEVAARASASLSGALARLGFGELLLRLASLRAQCPPAGAGAFFLADVRDAKLFAATFEAYRRGAFADLELLAFLGEQSARPGSPPEVAIRCDLFTKGLRRADEAEIARLLEDLARLGGEEGLRMVARLYSVFGRPIGPHVARALAKFRGAAALELCLSSINDEDDACTRAALDALDAFRGPGLLDAVRTAFDRNPRPPLVEAFAAAAGSNAIPDLVRRIDAFGAADWPARLARTCVAIDAAESFEYVGALFEKHPRALPERFCAGLLPLDAGRLSRSVVPLAFAWAVRLGFSPNLEVARAAADALEKLEETWTIPRLYGLCQNRLHSVQGILSPVRSELLAEPPPGATPQARGGRLVAALLFVRRLDDDRLMVQLLWKAADGDTFVGVLNVLAERSRRPVWRAAWRALFGTVRVVPRSHSRSRPFVQALLKALSFPQTSAAAHDTLLRLLPQFPLDSREAIQEVLPTPEDEAKHLRAIALVNTRAAADYLRNTIYDTSPQPIRDLYNELMRSIPIAAVLEKTSDEMRLLLDKLLSEDASERSSAAQTLDVCAVEGSFTSVLEEWLTRLDLAAPEIKTRATSALTVPQKIRDDAALGWRLSVFSRLGPAHEVLPATLRLFLDAANQRQFDRVLAALEQVQGHIPWELVRDVFFGGSPGELEALSGYRPEIAFAALFALWQGRGAPR